MPGGPIDVYRTTRKKNDQLFNAYFMRPLAAVVVAAVHRTPITPNQLTLLNLFLFLVAAGLFVALPDLRGSLIAVAVLELSYCFDCADGMLARYKKLASTTGHLFDFFTDELKAVLLAGSLGVRLWRTGGLGIDGTTWATGDSRFLLGAIASVIVVASAISLTNFVRRPELTGKETPVASHYEAEGAKTTTSPVAWVASQVFTFLRFLNHYPSHIYLFALAGKLDAFFWMYLGLNAMYLARGWLGLLLRFGRF
jgi:phosphatidylserine synthase